MKQKVYLLFVYLQGCYQEVARWSVKWVSILAGNTAALVFLQVGQWVKCIPKIPPLGEKKPKTQQMETHLVTHLQVRKDSFGKKQNKQVPPYNSHIQRSMGEMFTKDTSPGIKLNKNTTDANSSCDTFIKLLQGRKDSFGKKAKQASSPIKQPYSEVNERNVYQRYFP